MNFRTTLALALAALLLTACNLSLAADVTPPPGYRSPTPLPTAAPLVPPAAPDPERGAAIYQTSCAPCHGPTGLGDGPQGLQLPVPVAAIGLPDISRQASPAAWFAVVTQGRLDRYMPPFTSLSDQQRWDVVAYSLTLNTDAEAAAGQAIYEANCARCHGPQGDALPTVSFKNQARMASLSQADLYRLVASGNPPAMPAFEGTLSEMDLWYVTAYLRRLSFATPGLAEPPAPTATPDAAATEAPGTGSESGSANQAEGAATEPAPSATLTVTGTLVHGGGLPLPSDQIVTLRGFTHGASGEISEIYSASQTVGPDGSYRFEGAPVEGGPIYLVEAIYQGLAFTSDPAFIQAGMTLVDLPVTLYETTSDASRLSIDRWHIFLNFDRQDVVQVVEVLIVSNPELQVVVPSQAGGPVLSVPLPEGAFNLQFEDTAEPGLRFIQTADGFYDTQPIGPGVGAYQLLFAFDLPYNGKLEFRQPGALPADSIVVLVPEGVTVRSDRLSDGGLRSFQGQNYQLYEGQTLPAGATLEMTVRGKTGAGLPALQLDSRQGIMIGAAALGIALVLTGVYLFWRDRRRAQDEEEEEEAEEDEAEEEEDQEDILDAIIALDDLHKAGQIPDEAYRERRAELTARLKRHLGEGD